MQKFLSCLHMLYQKTQSISEIQKKGRNATMYT